MKTIRTVIFLTFALLASVAANAQSKVVLQWLPDSATIPTDPGTYAVQRAILVNGNIGTYAQIAKGITALTFTDTLVTAGASYAYTVTFTYAAPLSSSSATSDPCPPAIVTIPGTPPPPTPTPTPKPPPVTGLTATPQ